MVQAIININEKTNRVLNMIKAKYGLHNKSEAINKFVDLYEDDFLEPELKESFVKELITSSEAHMREHPERRMSLEDLDKF